MKKMEIDFMEHWYSSNYQKKLKGRYITLEQIEPLLNSLKSNFAMKKIGASALNKNIYGVTFGTGKENILIWTQMHGNESTGTKALFDLFNFFDDPHDLSAIANQILSKYTINCIPMLNPDGAFAYTRVNALGIDLNRDVIDKKAVESILLQQILKELAPKYCFNMHDQRTIFSVGKNQNPATISFLAPSVDKERNLTEGRKQTMEVIVSMHKLLQRLIPNHIGRYTDEFYPTATGDNFQKMGFNTILIESGHYKDDYLREITRKHTFYSLIQGLYHISKSEENLNEVNFKAYFDIPNNEKLYLDVILKNVNYKNEIVDVGVFFVEKLINKKVVFSPTIEIIGNLSLHNANKYISNLNLTFFDKASLINWLQNELN